MLTVDEVIDPDILYALKTLANDDSDRLVKVQAMQAKRVQQQFETQMQLLVDEVERVVPRTHPLFDLVLTIAVARKVERKQQEPEFQSDLEAGWPAGW